MNDKEECSKIEAFKKEFSNDWNTLNLQAKSLIFIGFLVLILTICIPCLPNFPKNIGVLFRSVLASIFGFFLSSGIKSEKINSKKLRTSENCNKEIKKYNFKDGNMIQIIIAFSICIISMISMFILYGFGIGDCTETISQMRDLMCSSIGFLLGEANIKK